MTKQIYMIHENDQWTQPLCDALKELNLPLKTGHLYEDSIDFSKKTPD